MADDGDTFDGADESSASRRTFLKRALALGTLSLRVVAEPLVVFARPSYNLTFFRTQETVLRVTQSFAVAGTNVPLPDVRVTQSFAVAGTNVPPPDMRVTQSFAVAGTNVPAPDMRVTQSFAVTGTNVPPPDVRVTQSFVQALVSY